MLFPLAMRHFVLRVDANFPNVEFHNYDISLDLVHDYLLPVCMVISEYEKIYLFVYEY